MDLAALQTTVAALAAGTADPGDRRHRDHRVSTARAGLGASQNRFEHTINTLNVAVENLSASESRIRDTDMAAEMVNFTKSQILQQAGTAMLAQANQSSQGVLQLLRWPDRPRRRPPPPPAGAGSTVDRGHPGRRGPDGRHAVGGLVSGLDTATIVSQLMQLEAPPQNALKARVTRAGSR